MARVRQPAGSDAGPLELAINADLNFYRVPEIHRRLAAAIGQGSPVRLVLENLGAIDLAGLQLVYSAVRSAAARGTGFCISGADAPRLARLAAHAGLPALPIETAAGDGASHES
jgi:anti-anti-sigma regulatory factor